MKIAGKGNLKGVQMAVFWVKWSSEQRKEAIKVLGTCFSYNDIIKEESNFLKSVSNVQAGLKPWRFWNITVEGGIVILENLKALLAPVPSQIIKALVTDLLLIE